MGQTQKTLSSQVMRTLSSEGQGMDAPGSKGLEAEDTPEIVRTPVTRVPACESRLALKGNVVTCCMGCFRQSWAKEQRLDSNGLRFAVDRNE